MKQRERGNSVVEVLTVVAAMAVLGAVGALGIHHASVRTKERTLEQQVASLNRAVGVYMTSGGSLANPLGENPPAGLTVEEAVIQKLQSVASSTMKDKINGLRDSVLESRLVPVIEELDEEDDEKDVPLVVWNAQKQSFVISTGVRKGIKEFVYDDSRAAQAPLEEVRERTLDLAEEDPWIWDHEPRQVETSGPSFVVAGTSYSGPGGFVPNSPEAITLQDPVFSEPGGLYELISFSRSVTLTNPNPEGTSQILYTVDGGNWDVYRGEVIDLPLETTVQAYVATLDPDNWRDSNIAGEFWDGQPVQLDLEVFAPQDSYNFAQVGGEMLPGEVGPLPAAPDPAEVRVLNFHEFPVDFFAESGVKAEFSYDGKVPDASEGIGHHGVLTPEAPVYEVDLSLSAWGSLDHLELKARGRGNGSKYVVDSELVSRILEIAPIALREPVASEEGGVVTTNKVVKFRREAAFGDMPSGSRIYYTTDGSDPLNSDGTPRVEARLLSDGVTMEGVEGDGYKDGVPVFGEDGRARRLTARVTGPEGYEHWFQPSQPVTLEFSQYQPDEWHGYIVGDFGTSEMGRYRNIKQHDVNGLLDKDFDPAQGFDGAVKDIVWDPVQKHYVVVGHFQHYNEAPCNRIAAITPEGDLVNDFGGALGGFDGDADCIAILKEDINGVGVRRYIVGGDFTSFAGSPAIRVACLESDGDLDTSFKTSEKGPNDDVYAVQTFGNEIFIGGHFTGFVSATGDPADPAGYLAKLKADGDVDGSFKGEANDTVWDLAVQTEFHTSAGAEVSEPHLIVVGNFNQYGEDKRVRVARVELDSGDLDPTFDPGDGANKEVFTVSLYSNGDVFVAGRFGSVDNNVRKGVARLHGDDGSLDESFDVANGLPGTGLGVPSWILYDSVIGANDSVIVGGRLTNYQKLARGAFRRILKDGTIDRAWQAEDLAQGSIVYAVEIAMGAVQSADGGASTAAVVVGGLFDDEQEIHGQRDIARVNPETGALDANFDVGSGTNAEGYVSDVERLGDGSVVVAGQFVSVNGYTHRHIAKLGPNGTVDNTFNAWVSKEQEGYFKVDFDAPFMQHGTVINDQYYLDEMLTISALNNLAPEHPDTAILFDTNQVNTLDPDLESPWAGGNIEHYLDYGLYTDFGNALIIAENDVDLDGDGIVDNPSDEAAGGSITFSLDLRDDVVGFQATFIDFEAVDNYSITLTAVDDLNQQIVEFTDFVDPSSLWYDPYIGIGNNYVNILPEVWASDLGLENFSEITFTFAGAGAIDDLYFITDENVSPLEIRPASISAIAVSGDRIFVGGDFNTVNGAWRKNIACLTSGGQLDVNFAAGDGFDGPVRALEVDRDGNLLVGGEFSSYNGQPAPGIVRLFADGTRDDSFVTPPGALVYAIKALPDGAVAYAGSFVAPTIGVAVVDENGTPVEGFSTGDGTSGVYSLDLMPDGRMVIGGAFSSYDGSPTPCVACLLPNGQLDPSFSVGSGPDGDVHHVRVLPNGKLLLCGSFDNCDGAERDGSARLLADGTLDATFSDTGLVVDRIAGSK